MSTTTPTADPIIERLLALVAADLESERLGAERARADAWVPVVVSDAEYAELAGE